MASRFCSTCGSAVTAGERFCRQCGTTVSDVQMGGQQPEPGAAPGGYAQQPYGGQTYAAQPYERQYQPQYSQPQYGPPAYGAWQPGMPRGETDLLQLDIQYPASLSRGLIFIKWLLVIPHFVVLMLYGLAAYVVTGIAWFAILFAGKYPRGMFDFMVNFLRYSANVMAYYGLMRDEYPPFGGAPDAYAPVRLTLGYSEHLSRGLIFIKWLLVIPSLVVVMVLYYAASFCLFIAWFAILFTGRFPEGMFRFVVGVMRWYYRTVAYYLLLTDRYPPFTTAAFPEGSAPPAGYAPA